MRNFDTNLPPINNHYVCLGPHQLKSPATVIQYRLSLATFIIIMQLILQEASLPPTLLAPALHTIGDIRQEREVLNLEVGDLSHVTIFPP